MAQYYPSKSAVFTRLFQPVLDAYPSSLKPYKCRELSDLDFLEMGILRCASDSKTGRDFLQRHGDHGRKQVEVDLFFKALQSTRREVNTASINQLLVQPMSERSEDPFASHVELENFALYAGDGHYHSAAVHDPKFTSSKGQQKKYAVGHFFMLNLRTHHLALLASEQKGGIRRKEHDMHALKRKHADALRQGEPTGRQVIIVWDKAGIDFGFWQKLKKSSGVYFISREKENMELMNCGNTPIDRADKRNDGVVSDELVGPGGGGSVLRRITYIDPVEEKEYIYLTTEMNLPPGIIALLYKKRWDIEKVFDELKNKLNEKKAWASSPTAKKMNAQFLCLTHNLLMLLEEQLLQAEAVDNVRERVRKSKRKAVAIQKGGNFVATALQRFTVRSVKFIRWLRNFAYREVPWSEAVARLRQIYATF